MAYTLEQLQAERQKIIAEMSRPQEQQFGDRRLTRRPIGDLESALRRIDAEIAGLQPAKSSIFTINSSRGLQ
jgi:5-enolpyruvylshikimate-3-phosphate synthase